MNLANRIAEEGGDLGEAISCYDQALELVGRTELPELWGQVQHNLALAWRDRTDGDPAANLERAIGAYESALEVRSGGLWAATAASLAGVLLERLEGVAADNVERRSSSPNRRLVTCRASGARVCSTTSRSHTDYVTRRATSSARSPRDARH